MPRIFLSHSSKDNTEAIALRQWLIDQRPELVNEIFLDISEDTGLAPGQRWKDALRRASQRCEAVICLVSRSWGSSPECKTEYRTAETLGKQILVARRRAAAGNRQPGSQGSVMGRRQQRVPYPAHRLCRSTVRQTDHQYEQRAVACVGIARHRLHSGMSGSTHPARRRWSYAGAQSHALAAQNPATA
jgi:hypothetical protein